jgi:hypothetical protein
MGPHARADYNPTLLYLIVDSEVQLSTQTTKGKEWGGLFFWLGTLVSVC